MLSVVVAAYNEEDWIKNCLKSVSVVASEIVVVVDDRTTDKTPQIAKDFNAKIFTRKFDGFSGQKNFALTKTTGDWILFLDADERISKNLAQEIVQILKDPQASGYAFPRQNIFLGQKMRFGGWWPDYVTRLVKKDNFSGWKGNLHESLQVKGETAKLQNPMYHLSHRGITWMLTTSIAYTPIEAKLRYDANHPKVTWWRLFRVMFTEFWYRFVVKSGWRDGTVGIIEAISQSFNMFLVYVHLWEMQKGKSMEKTYKEIDQNLAENGF